MASFFEDLFSSIFTPGATPTLLIATNATFAALQVVFFALLVATYSIHFVILSFISGALWYSINWFAEEVKAENDRQQRLAQNKKNDKDDGDDDEEYGGSSTDLASLRTKKAASPVARLSGPISDSAESGTETESIRAGVVGNPKLPSVSAPKNVPAVRRSTPSATGAQTTLTPESSTDDLKQRKPSGESSGYISTDSEWEKVDNKNR